MKKGRYSEEQTLGKLKRYEAGVKTVDQGRGHGISDAMFCNWKYGGPDVSEGQRLSQMENENRRLKQFIADLNLVREVLDAVLLGICLTDAQFVSRRGIKASRRCR
jgi:putative transposase